MILTMISLSCTVNEQSILEMSKAIHDGMTLLLKMKITVKIAGSHKPFMDTGLVSCVNNVNCNKLIVCFIVSNIYIESILIEESL